MEKQPSTLHCLPWMLILQTCWLGLVRSSSSWVSGNSTDLAALLTFKSCISLHPNDTLSKSWNTNTSFCNWAGVSCSLRRQRVTKLDLSSMGLEGTIPPHIGNLSFLAYLYLGNNNFHGHLPHELGFLRRLKEFDLAKNQMEGTIPPSLGHCRQLRNLRFSANKLEGTIPPSLANLSELHFLFFRNNSLQGNIPTDFGRLLNLRYLDFYGNELSGEIPLAIFNISSLIKLTFSHNNLSGQLPADTGRFLPNLEGIYVDSNRLSGSIPIFLANASKLTQLNLGENSFKGSIPNTLGHLIHLEILGMGDNNLTGTIPSSIFNLSYLTQLSFGFNQLSGHLPPEIGNQLPNIAVLYLNYNRFVGQIPLSLGNASKLSLLDLSNNDFTGSVPSTLGKLASLKILILQTNQLMNEPGIYKLDFLTYLTSCRLLEVLGLSGNPMRGILPSSIGNFSSLQKFYAYGCQIEGTIPREFGNLSSLFILSLHHNNLHGTIPSTIGRLEKLQGLDLSFNMLQGSIPIELGNLRYLALLILDQNMLSGGIPDLFQNISGLQEISLANNKLSELPMSLWNLQDLLSLNLSRNLLGGLIPQEVGNLKKVTKVDFAANQFDGSIPNSMGQLQMLQHLDLRSNSLEGPIPQSFGDLISIEFMDLSSNHLNGTIPKSLEFLHELKFLNLSFNSLQGEIPNGGVFANFTAQSFTGNSDLCTTPKLHIKLNVSVCPTLITKSRVGDRVMKIIISVLVVTTLVVCFSLLLMYHTKKEKTLSHTESLPIRIHKMISYQELLHATSNFSEDNLIGTGHFSSVYKGTMVDGSIVAVKVLNIQIEGAWESFDTECEVMRNVRHRNLVKIITSCSNLDFRALVLQFMPNGNLEQWLYSHNNYLSLFQRIGIMIDVASAMEYLHHQYSSPVVHCDLNPRNVLLDEDMIAYVSDFGIAKLLVENHSATQTNTVGTIGYIAPEYGLVGKVSTKGDVYSYGILLLEMLTRKKPTDNMFTGGMSLRQWINASFPNSIMDVMDKNLMRETGKSGNEGAEVEPHGRRLLCLLAIVEVGLLCSKELAEERINMKDVVVRLMNIKREFFSL